MKTKILSKTAKVHEVFVSRQGEGLFVGEKQIFFRFSRCNMVCNYCDTDNSVGQTQSVGEILSLLEKNYWQEEGVTGLSLTGGEPLLYPEMIAEISGWARSMGLRIFLETNGTLPQALALVAHAVDVVSMDIKLPSVSATPAYWKEHQAFLKTMLDLKKESYLKIVVSEEVCLKEFDLAVELVAEQSAELPLFLQPVTPIREVKPISSEKIKFLQERALSQLWDVRIQPQWHKYWGVR